MCGGVGIVPVGSPGQGWAFKKRLKCLCGFMSPSREEIPSSSNSSCWVTELVSQGINSQPPQIQKEQGEKHLKVQHLAVDVWERAAACPTIGGIGRPPPSLGLQHQPWASPAAFLLPSQGHHHDKGTFGHPSRGKMGKKEERQVP